MSGLSDFLNPILPEEEEVYVSERFVKHNEKGEVLMDKDGNPVLAPFRIKPLSQADNDVISRKATKIRMVNGAKVQELDSLDYGRRLVVAGTVEPDFTNSALCEKFGTLDPLEVPGKMLLAGEYSKLMQAISDISGFGGGKEIQEEAKN